MTSVIVFMVRSISCVVLSVVSFSNHRSFLERYSVSPMIFNDAGKTTAVFFSFTCFLDYCKPLIISSADHRRREEAAPIGATLPPSVVISSETPVGKPIIKTVPQSSKHGSRVPSPGSAQRQSPTQELEQTVPPKEKPALVKPNASIFLQTANFLLEVNALQVQGKKTLLLICC